VGNGVGAPGVPLRSTPGSGERVVRVDCDVGVSAGDSVVAEIVEDGMLGDIPVFGAALLGVQAVSSRQATSRMKCVCLNGVCLDASISIQGGDSPPAGGLYNTTRA
jgi:hypothetical protein